MDPSDLLSAGFNTLNLQSRTTAATVAANTSLHKTPQFTIFGELPVELRLKIFEHALPAPETINVSASVLLADADFGLYLTFSIKPPPKAPAKHTFGNRTIVASVGWYHKARCLALLFVNKECRGVYLDKLPYQIPTGPPGQGYRGKIRYARNETIYITNFDMLVHEWDIIRAFDDGWLLQQLFKEVESLMVPIKWFLAGTEELQIRARILRSFTNLKLLKAKMWDAFGQEMAEDVREQIKKGMVNALESVERLLMEWEEEEQDTEYRVPKFELQF